MQLNIDTRIKKDADLDLTVMGSTDVLKEELGSSADRVIVDWKLNEDEKERTIVELTLTDSNWSQTCEFAPDELAEPTKVQARVQRLWGDLLQKRFRGQLESIQESLKDSLES